MSKPVDLLKDIIKINEKIDKSREVRRGLKEALKYLATPMGQKIENGNGHYPVHLESLKIRTAFMGCGTGGVKEYEIDFEMTEGLVNELIMLNGLIEADCVMKLEKLEVELKIERDKFVKGYWK